MQGMTIGLLAAAAALGLCRIASAENKKPVRAELNGLLIAVDADSGGLLELEYDGMSMLQASPETASLLDAAYPGYGFDPLRLGVRYSKRARVEKADGRLVITWDALGMSRAFEPKGSVSAAVYFQPTPDGRSVLLTASLNNQSELAIPQVLFPDLAGLRPFAGEDLTEFRTCGFVMSPFRELKLPEDDGRWYATRRNWSELKWGAYDKSMAGRWMDLGSLQGGFSLFPKLWSWGPLNQSGEPTTDRVFLHLSQPDGALRLMCEHKVTIAPGERWTSPEYVLTPHRHGWAKGIEPFRAWVNENIQRPYRLPKHLRETLGYRSVWMAEQYVDADPAASAVVWRFRDLPELAEECRAHGLNEMVLWFWQPWTISDQPSPELGTRDEFVQAVEGCRAKGVNVSLFVSVMTLLGPIPLKYGWHGAKEYWGYHADFVPMLRPYYGQVSRGSFADQTHPGWQADVSANLLKIIESGWHSITWDQALHATAEPNLTTIFGKVRAAAKKKDPEATFAAENLNNIDLDSRWLDYTWNWVVFEENLDCRALVNAYTTPHFNVNVGTSPRAVKRLFMDHLFLNVMPSKPEGINGSARIAEYPELSRALKTCAMLHEKFLHYFEDGLLVGDCILSEPCEEARVNGYVLPDKVLILVMNTGPRARPITFTCDLSPWLYAPSGRYCAIPYDEEGNAHTAPVEVSASWQETTPTLQPDELVLYEVASQG